MSCLFCEKIDATTFYSLNKTRTLHSLTPIRSFFEKILGRSIRTKESETLSCETCYNKLNEVDEMEMKIKEISNEMISKYKENDNTKERIIISSDDNSEIISVITVDHPDYFEYDHDTEGSMKSKHYNRNYSGKKDVNYDLTTPCEIKEEPNIKKEIIHFTDQHDLKNILDMKIKKEEDSFEWEDNIEPDVNILYDMMEEKNIEVYLEPKDSNESQTKCTKCDLSFSSKQELKSHIATHVENMPYICEICGKIYRHKSALNIHVGMHNGIVPFKCLHCDKTFTQKGAMIRHNKIHTGEKPYQCEECGKCFTHHTSFTIHKISHTGEKSYKCNICGLMLMSTSHLKRHLRVHTGEKRYSCTTCGKRFAEKYNLVSHTKLHTNGAVTTQKRKFRCELCNLVFFQRLQLEEHVSSMHSSNDHNYD